MKTYKVEDKNEKTINIPENRKEVYLMWERDIAEVIKSGKQEAIINCLVQSIINAAPDIPRNAYKVENIDKCRPEYKTVRKDYFKERSMLIPEMEYALQKNIQREYNKIWIMNLIKERRKVIFYLKKYTNWYFDKGDYGTPQI